MSVPERHILTWEIFLGWPSRYDRVCIVTPMASSRFRRLVRWDAPSQNLSVIIFIFVPRWLAAQPALVCYISSTFAIALMPLTSFLLVIFFIHLPLYTHLLARSQIIDGLSLRRLPCAFVLHACLCTYNLISNFLRRTCLDGRNISTCCHSQQTHLPLCQPIRHFCHFLRKQEL